MSKFILRSNITHDMDRLWWIQKKIVFVLRNYFSFAADKAKLARRTMWLRSILQTVYLRARYRYSFTIKINYRARRSKEHTAGCETKAWAACKSKVSTAVTRWLKRMVEWHSLIYKNKMRYLKNWLVRKTWLNGKILLIIVFIIKIT